VERLNSYIDKMPNTLFIRELTESDLPAVAGVHIKAFADSLLTRMGKRVVHKFYRWQSQPPNDCYAIGAFIDEKLAGFCFSGFFYDAEVYFIMRYWYLTIPGFIKNPELIRQVKPFKRMRYIIKSRIRRIRDKKVKTQESRPAIKRYGVLSIAVSPSCQRFGVGRDLMKSVYMDALQKGFELIQLSVHPDNEKAVKFYEKEGWTKDIDDKGTWSGVMVKIVRETL
jgi:ribosomal protein S18 acetylase RimI-like enzyme